MKARTFLDGMRALGVDFYTGVPDSLLKPLCDSICAEYGLNGSHIVAANEGGAVALAAGHFIGTGKLSLVYLQNSGIGNAVNPIASLLDERVYGIPCVFAVGWRGEPGIPDEPQHAFQGLITKELLSLLSLSVYELHPSTGQEAFQAMLAQARLVLDGGKSVAFLVHKGAFSDGFQQQAEPLRSLAREDAIRIILRSSAGDDIFVCTTGKTSREVFELREELNMGHARDFLTVGSMGHAGMIALGIAKTRPERTVWLLDGDGAALMHLGGSVVEAVQRRPNLIHVLLNNGCHESVGGMPVASGTLEFAPIARAMGFEPCFSGESLEELQTHLSRIRDHDRSGVCFLEILLRPGSREDLGRPTLAPRQNLLGLMAALKSPVKKP